jgi:hypothetical protein
VTISTGSVSRANSIIATASRDKTNAISTD